MKWEADEQKPACRGSEYLHLLFTCTHMCICILYNFNKVNMLPIR